MQRVLPPLTLALALYACSGEKPEAPAPAQPAPAQPAQPAQPAPKAEPAAPPAPPPIPPGATIKPDDSGIVHLTADDQMRYNAARIEVKAGEKVKVELKHVGTMPKAAMGHNFTLLVSGSDPMAFAQSAVTAVANDYMPSDMSKVVAHTKLLGGGESDTIEFDLPGPGTYPFLCTFPGHVALMRGELVAQ